MFNRFSLAFALLFFAACSKEHSGNADCDKLKQSIITGEPDFVENEINKIFSGMQVSVDSKESLIRLATAISTHCSSKAEVICYNCIYTCPAQSEIKIFISSAGTQKEKIIDVAYSSDNKFVFAGMHD